MAVALYGTKLGMTRVYDGEEAVPVTVIQCLPNEVVEVKTPEKHGFAALKVAVGRRRRKLNKPIAGEYQKAKVAFREALREVPVAPGIEAKPGAQLTVALLDASKRCDVVGISKGRGFAGVMKRHNFAGQYASHGHMGERRPGSIGARMDPARIDPGHPMAGHYGHERVTVRNLRIMSIDPENHLVVVKGAVPGPNGGLVEIKQA
ncbi:MAG: 50S ribosomal protein L3 [Planctomycetota bacterium]|nr:50S ribosomal protein L3 [Planctomycetota bacterium]MCX8040839.1 50S ribosomal protein L3 [Planctomycetota bacterium]MDW8372290.1 50S ribosomal protein L3 [Planctomycetota bacterium]